MGSSSRCPIVRSLDCYSGHLPVDWPSLLPSISSSPSYYVLCSSKIDQGRKRLGEFAILFSVLSTGLIWNRMNDVLDSLILYTFESGALTSCVCLVSRTDRLAKGIY